MEQDRHGYYQGRDDVDLLATSISMPTPDGSPSGRNNFNVFVKGLSGQLEHQSRYHSSSSD